MAIRTRKLNQKGYTLIEMAIAAVVLAIMATTVILANRFLNKQAVTNADQTFATEKAIQMYEELRALVNGNEQLGVAVLDNYSNGAYYDHVLTTDTNVDTGAANANPGDPLSGNIKSDGNWRYIRQVEVNRLANDTYARQVTVKVYLYPGDFATLSSPISQTGTLLSTVGGIMRTSAQPYAPTQVMDLYILDINNIPAWWAVLPTLGGYMENSIIDLTNRIPQLQLRTHYITRSSYGRDPLYVPETNSSANGTEVTPQKWVYFYPGYVPQDSGSDYYYYDPDTSGNQNSLLLTGNFMVDGTAYPISTSQFSSGKAPQVVSYSVADQYNNAMRYPDELAAYQAVTAAAASYVAGGGTPAEGVTEISERMLLEGMLSQPASFANAMIINLHGELLPLPPLRNYSDAAKDPSNQLSQLSTPMTCNIALSNGVSQNQNVRVVTHPELLYYPGAAAGSTAVTVRLRVYAYYDSEDVGGVAHLPAGDPRVPAISLFLPDASATVLGVTCIYGSSAIQYGSQASPTAFAAPPNSTASGTYTSDTGATPMSMSVSYVGPNQKQTLITLYNTPLRCPSYATGAHGGLNSADLLYGSEYIPCAPDMTSGSSNLTSGTYTANTYSFTSSDLTRAVTNSGTPKNTARWVITLSMPITQAYTSAITFTNEPYNISTVYSSGTTITGQHIIETYLGNAVTNIPYFISGGVTTTVTPDISRTYVWCGDNTKPPYTEQYQFMGDPRDCPYYDVKVGGVSISGAAVTIGPNAYNWWFKNGNSGNGMYSDGYRGFDAAGGDGTNPPFNGNIGIDLPRYYQMIRQGLLNTTSIWTTTNGWSFYYYGIGGEIGFDHSPMTTGVKVLNSVFNTSNTAVLNGYDSINGDGKSGASPAIGLWVASRVISNNGGAVTWYQRSWLGELYPDRSYNTWVTYGNLPTVSTSLASAAAPETFFLQTMQNINQIGPSGSSDDGFNGNTFYPMPNGNGCEAFFNGVSIGTSNTYQHVGSGTTGTEANLGVTTYNVYPFPLAESVSVQRPWNFASGTPPGWGDDPYDFASMRTALDVPATLTDGADTTARIFYTNDADSSKIASGVVRMKTVNSGTTQIGYVVETGTAPSGSVGAQTLAETALIYAMRTFLDGGQMAATNKAGHIVQIPLVKIFPVNPVPQYNASGTIGVTIGSPVTATSANGGAVSVGMPVTDIWWRFNASGLASYYTEEYPNYGNAMTGTGMYQESVSVIYNLKYSNNAGQNWYFVQDSSAAVSGTCNTSASYAVTNLAPWVYNWSVATGGPGGTVLTQGDYLLMVEAYRQNYGLHYAYDIYDLSISW